MKTATYNPKTKIVYLQSFLNLALNLRYPLLAFIDERSGMARGVKRAARHMPASVQTRPWPFDSFLRRFKSDTESVLRSKQFADLLPAATRRLRLPEFSVAAYSLVNHDKVTLLREAFRLVPNASHYFWVDWSLVRETLWFLPRAVDVCHLGERIAYLGNAKAFKRLAHTPALRSTPRQVIRKGGCPEGADVGRNCTDENGARGDIAVCGTAFAVPAGLVERFYALYEHELEAWLLKHQIVDDDQSLIYQLAAAHPSLFHVLAWPSPGAWWYHAWKRVSPPGLKPGSIYPCMCLL